MSCALEPEDLWAVMNRYRETVREMVRSLGGIICHHKGDGILCCFGYPAAHEDNASRAVMAALGVLSHMERENRRCAVGDNSATPLRLRIGIATGEVAIVDNRASDPDGLELLGPAPNLAARLQTGAGQNMALVDDTTYRLTRSEFRFAPARTARLKGFRDPITVHRPVAAEPRRTRFERSGGGRLSEFVNRAHEQSALCDAWRQTCAGRGQVVLVTGDAGIGKSRLVRHFLEGLGEARPRDIELQCSALCSRTTLHPFAAGLSHFIGLEETDTEEAKVHRLRAFLAGLGIRDGYSVPLLGHLIGLAAAQCLPLLGMLTQTEIARRTAALMVTCLAALADRHPVILFVEDVHWADAASLDLIEALAAGSVCRPVMILLTSRPSPRTGPCAPLDALHNAPNSRVLTLERLGRRDAARIAASIAHLAGAGPLRGDWIDRIVERSDGVPLFIEELTRAVIDKASDAATLPQHSSVRGPDDGIPATLRDSLAARLDRLRFGLPGGPSPKWIAQIGACIGREFSREMLMRLADMPGIAMPGTHGPCKREALLQDALNRLVEADLICPVSDLGDSYRFKHALVQDAAYAGLWRDDRKYIHACLLALLEENGGAEVAGSVASGARPELLAHHACRAGMPETAVRHWLTAGQHAARRSNMTEARSSYEEARRIARTIADETKRTDAELEALVALGTVRMMEKGVGGLGVEHCFDEARKLGEEKNGDRGLTASAQLGKQLILTVRGRNREALGLARTCLATAQLAQERSYEMEARRQYGVALFWNGRLQEACRHFSTVALRHEEARPGYLSVLFGPDLRTASLSLLALSQALLGLSETALETSRQSMRIAMETNHNHNLGYALLCRAMLFDLLELAECGDAAETAVEFCTNRDLRFWAAWSRVVQGNALIRMGNAAEGLRQAEAGFDAFIGTGAGVARPHLIAILANGDQRLGADKRALKRLETACRIAREDGETLFESELWRARALLGKDTAAPRRTERLFTAALRRTRERGLLLFEARTALDFGHWLTATARCKEARTVVAETLERCREGEDRAGMALLETFLQENAA